MGRGRAKAKQVKVARRLKYDTGGTDLDRLRDELGVGASPSDQDDIDGYDDPYEDDAGEDDLYADPVNRHADLMDDEDEYPGADDRDDSRP